LQLLAPHALVAAPPAAHLPSLHFEIVGEAAADLGGWEPLHLVDLLEDELGLLADGPPRLGGLAARAGAVARVALAVVVAGELAVVVGGVVQWWAALG